MVIIVMGVSGCGKTTIGQRLAGRMGCDYFDGDDFHPAENIEKMGLGIPLDDTDREGWLARLVDLVSKLDASGCTAVLACSALKEKYRRRLKVTPRVRFVFLKGSYALILARMQTRPAHYMKPEMLVSQFAALEEPAEAITVDIQASPDEIVNQVLDALGLTF